MDINSLKFMSIGSNCADIWYLGEQRIHGPVDNMVIKSSNGVDLILTGKLFNQIYSEKFTVEDKQWTHSDDLDKILNYTDFKIVHNNPNTDKFKEELNKRLITIYNFIYNIRSEKNWLVFNFNHYFVTNDHLPTEELNKLIKLLKDKQILDKVIFVQLIRKDPQIEHKWDAWLNDTEIKKLNIKVISITDVPKAENAAKQFKSQLNLLLSKGVKL